MTRTHYVSSCSTARAVALRHCGRLLLFPGSVTKLENSADNFRGRWTHKTWENERGRKRGSYAHAAGDQSGDIKENRGGKRGNREIHFEARTREGGERRSLSFPPSFHPYFLSMPHMMSPITPSRRLWRPANSYHYSRRAAAGARVGQTKREGSRKTIIYLSKLPNRGKNAVGERSARGGGKGNKNDRLTEGESME